MYRGIKRQVPAQTSTHICPLTIARQLVQAATAGDPQGLVEHITRTQDRDVCLTLSFLPLLHVNLIPRLPITSEGRKNVVAARSALSVVFTQSVVILSSSKPKEPLVQLLIAHYHEVLKWLHFILDHWTKIFTDEVQLPFSLVIAYFLCTMVDTDDSLTEMVMSEPVAVKIVLRLWNKKIDSDRYITGDRAEYCVIVDLLERILKHELGRDQLRVMLHTNTRRVARVFTTVRKRVQELSFFRVAVSSRISRLEDLVRLARPLRSLSRQLPGSFNRPLHSPNFICDICYTLDTILQWNTHNFPVEAAKRLISAIFDLTLGDHGVELNPVDNVRGALQGGFYSILVKTLFRLAPSDNMHGVILRILTELATYSIYPTVSRSILPATRRVSWEIESSEGLSTTFQAYWDTVTTWVEGRSKLGKGGGGSDDGGRTVRCLCYCLEVRSLVYSFLGFVKLTRGTA
jgi:hypothetical protein